MCERISAEESDLLEKKQAMQELLKDRRSTEVEEWCLTVVAGSGVTRVAVVGSRSSATEADLSVSDAEVLQKDTEADQRSVGQVKAPPQKKKEQ